MLGCESILSRSVQADTTAVQYECSNPTTSKGYGFAMALLNPWLSQSLHPTYCSAPWLSPRERGALYMPCLCLNTPRTLTLPFGQLLISMVTTIHCTRKHLWWDLKAADIESTWFNVILEHRFPGLSRLWRWRREMISSALSPWITILLHIVSYKKEQVP